MPRQVDAAQRKREIVDASVRILAEGGYSALTLRSLAKRMGGSITLITHYFQDREALISALLDQVIADADAITDQLKSIDDPRTRLFEVLKYFLPITDETMELERARVALTTQKNTVPAVADFFVRLEPGMRHVIEVALDRFIAPDALEETIDLLRAWTSGVVLVSIEHPEIWTPERQLKALERFMSLLDLPVPGDAQPSAAPTGS
jgi:AcrR family transcriptional regulator